MASLTFTAGLLHGFCHTKELRTVPNHRIIEIRLCSHDGYKMMSLLELDGKLFSSHKNSKFQNTFQFWIREKHQNCENFYELKITPKFQIRSIKTFCFEIFETFYFNFDLSFFKNILKIINNINFKIKSCSDRPKLSFSFENVKM